MFRNGQVVDLSQSADTATVVDIAQVLDPIDLYIRVDEGSHMIITVSFGDGSDDLLIETNGTERVFMRTHQFQQAGDLTTTVTADNLVTNVAETVTDDITIQAPVPEGGLTMTSDHASTVASLPPGTIQYLIEFDHSFAHAIIT